MRTIVVAGPGHLLVRQQEAIDEFGFLEFGMASRDGDLFVEFKVLPNPEMDQETLLRIARRAGNELLLETYAAMIRRNHKGGRYGRA